MKNATLLIFLLTISSLLKAQEAIFPKGNQAPNVNHTGDVWLSHVSDADDTFQFNVAQAVSAPGAKLNWHLHPKGQVLLVTHGVGLYQEKGKEVRVMRAGDVIKCPPNVEHWHAASPNNPVTYLAIGASNAPTQWTDKLTDEDYQNLAATAMDNSDIKEEIKKLSKQKWQWMADKDSENLAKLFHKDAQFVHMGGAWGTDREVEIIKSGGIWYKKADIHDVSVDVFGDIAILLNRITLVAEVGGNEVTNPFMVTEVYKKEDGKWMLANLSFVRQLDSQD